MTELAALGIKIEGSPEIKTVSDLLKRLSEEAEKTGQKINFLSNESKKSAKEVNYLADAAKKAVSAYAGFRGINAIKNFADGWSDMQSKVGSSLGDMSKAASTMQRVVDIANASYSPLRQTVDVFTRNVASFRDMGKSASAAADFTEALNHALVTTATKGQDADVVINSLSRSMAIGKLDADAFDTIVSRSPRVLQAMADKMGVATSSIREMARQGKVTSDVIASSLIESLDKLRDEAGAMPATIGDAFQQVTNNTTSLIGALDNITGASGAAAGGIMLFADGLRSLSENKDALDTIIIAGETLAVVLGSRLVTAGLASAGSFAAVQIAAIRAAGGINALAIASRAAQGALALVGGPLGVLVTAIGVGAFAWSQYGKSARDNADEGVLGLVDAKKSVEDLVIEFNKLNVLQQKQTLAIKQEELAKATTKAKEAVHELSEAYKPFTGKGINAVRQFNIAFKQETAALVANTHMTEAEMAQAFTDLIDGYIASGKAYEDQRPKLEEMAGAAVQAANDVRRLKEEMFAIDAMGPPSSAMNSPAAPRVSSGKEKKDPGADLLKQMQERIALIGKETEQEQLLAKIRVGSIKFQTEAQKQQAITYAQTIDAMEDMVEAEKAREEESKKSKERLIQAEIDKNNALLELDARLQEQREKQSAELATYGLGARAAQEMQGRIAIESQQQNYIAEMRKKHGEEMRDIELESERSNREAMFNERLMLTQSAFSKELALYEQHIKDKKAKEQDWELGWKSALDTYVEESQNKYQLAADFASNSFKTMEDSFVSFVKTGKLDFASLADSIISDIIRIQSRQMLSGVFSGVSGVGGFLGGILGFSSGGYTGPGGVNEPAGIVHKGEVVFSQADVSRLGGVDAVESIRKGSEFEEMHIAKSGGSSSLTINMPITMAVQQQSGGVDSSRLNQAGEQLSKMIKPAIQEEVAKMMRPGGLLWSGG